jgi:cell division protein ZapA
MSDLSITVNGRRYVIACEDGQEDHLARLADYIDKRIKEVVESVGQIGETRLMLMAGLLIADELGDAYAALAAEKGEADPGLVARLAEEDTASPQDPSMAEVLERLAVRLETLAGKLEQTDV